MKFAIIGAGIAGVYMAHRLKQLNHEVKILEKTDRAGGFCFDYVDENNISYPMAAMFILKKYADKRNIIKELAEQYDVPLIENRNAFYKDNDYKLTLLKMLCIQGGFIAYTAMYYYYHYIRSFGYTNIQTLKKRGMEEFLRVLRYEKMSLIGVMDDNYDIRNNFYILSPITLIEILLNLFFYSKTVLFLGDGGFMQIIEGLSKDVSIQYNANVESICRTEKKVKIRYSQSIEEDFDKVIIATYPHNILPIMSPLSAIEKKVLLSETVNMVSGGYTVLCDIEWIKEPHVFIKQAYVDGISFNYYSKIKQYSVVGVVFDNGVFDEDLLTKIIANNDGKLIKVIFKKDFSSYRLFYRNYDVTQQLNETLQGVNHTYYIGSVPTASGLTNSILNHCERIVEKIRKSQNENL